MCGVWKIVKRLERIWQYSCYSWSLVIFSFVIAHLNLFVMIRLSNTMHCSRFLISFIVSAKNGANCNKEDQLYDSLEKI